MNSKVYKLFFSIGIVISLFALGFYNNQKGLETQVALNLQKSRLELLNKKYDEFVTVSNLVSKFIEEDISGQGLTTQAQIESHLKQYLKSSSSEIIYGIGIWYLPFAFKQGVEYFGPYVHRSGDLSGESVLTYEWQTKTYDYPSRKWFRQGIEGSGKNVFVDPYIDNDLIYVTNSKSFYVKNKIAGVITVDLVLPQLQKLVESNSKPDQEIFYIVNRQGKLLAHPLKEKFLQNLKHTDSSPKSDILQFSPDEIHKSAGSELINWPQSELKLPELGWTIFVKTRDDLLFERIYQMRNILILGTVFLWIIFFGLAYFIRIREQERLEHSKKMELARIQVIQSSRMSAVGEMAANMAHEINNPLTVIVGKSNQIIRHLENGNSDFTWMLDNSRMISQQAIRISKIINELRTFSRSSTENEMLELSDYGNIIEMTLSLCRDRLRIAGIQIDVNQEQSFAILCRPSQISQVILILLTNAFEAVLRCSEKWIKIDIRCDQKSEKVITEISDSGAGIDSEIAQRIFEPFFTTKDFGKGAGMGLPIALGIIESHGGNLKLDRNTEYTRFSFELSKVINNTPS